MGTMIILIFILGYFLIAMEHSFKIDKAASALLTGVLCWTALILGKEAIFQGGIPGGGHDAGHYIEEMLLHHVGEIAEILFFLLGAMTIVELVDAHGGFKVVTDRIKTTKKLPLLWLICVITFFFSAILDNLTTAIVMAALLRKILSDTEDIWFFGGMVVIAANAGGAWSPIGDVTTIMLWIGGQVSAMHIIAQVFLPSLVCLLVPLGIVSLKMKGNIVSQEAMENNPAEGEYSVSTRERNFIFCLGVGGLLFVPVFKTLTHLPPFMGMLLSLGLLWLITELINKNKGSNERKGLAVAHILRKVDTPSVLFFLGILLAVASLQTAGHLVLLANTLDETFGNVYIINTLIGLLSAVVDNVPLVAGAMGMYSLEVYPQDSLFWELLAYCAGTGGSALIIGSAAGVAIMGALKIDFIWYVKRISLLAVAGYLSGVLVMYVLG